MWLGSRGWAVVLAAASLVDGGYALAASGSDVRACYGYSDSLPPLDADAPAVEFTDISQTGSHLELGDDSLSEVPIGFGFEFYRREFKTVWIASNGFITFLAENEPGCCEGQRVPDGLRPNGLIAGLWKDLNPAGSGVAYQTLGTAPNRRFVAQFTAVLENVDGPGGFPATFQIVLFEGSNEIRVVYVSAESGTKVASAGLEDLTGAFGLLWRHGAFSLSNVSVRYLPLGTDSDGDAVVDCIDTCRRVPDPSQADADGDGTGDACDLDTEPVGLAQQTPRVDTSPSAAPGPGGGALVVWDGVTLTDNQAIVARRVGPDGMPDGLPFQVSAETAPAHFDPRVASAPGGGFVVAWHRQLAPVGAAPQDTMRNRRIAADGVLGVEHDVLFNAPFSDGPSVGAFPSGRGLVAAATGDGGVVARLTDPTGQPILNELPVGVFPPSAESDIAMSGGSEALVVWRAVSGQLDDDAILVRRVDEAGNLLGAESPLSRVAWDGQRGPRAAPAATGGFVVTWSGYDGQGNSRIFSQRLDATAEKVGPQVQVFTPPGRWAGDSAVAGNAAGNFLVVWQENSGILAQRLQPDGRLLGGSFPVRIPAQGSVADRPAIAMTTTGDAVVAWREYVQISAASLPVAIAARRLSPCGNGNVDHGETCDDGNRTADDCCSPLCQLEPDGQVCNDGLACTAGETCRQGTCGGGAPPDCSDGIACTADRCDPEAGCLHDPAPADSSVCDDANPCTTDRCDVSAGCVHDGAPLEGQSCDDSSACTEGDTCVAGACGGRPLACADADACTADSCDAALGCVHSAPGADGASCDDGDDCTAEDVCGGGTCAGARFCGPGVPPGSELPARQGTVKLPCIGGAGSTCTAELFAEAPAQTGQSMALAGLGLGDQIVNPVRISKRVRARKLKRRGRVVLTIKLTGFGRRLVAGSPGGLLPVLARTTVAARGEAPRSSGILLFLRARGARAR